MSVEGKVVAWLHHTCLEGGQVKASVTFSPENPLTEFLRTKQRKEFEPTCEALVPASALVERDAEIARLRAEIERHQSDRAYVIGWNDGFDHIHGPLRFPTMLRKMWSGGEVQAWLDEQRIEAARVAAADEGSALQQAEARALAAEATLATRGAEIVKAVAAERERSFIEGAKWSLGAGMHYTLPALKSAAADFARARDGQVEERG